MSDTRLFINGIVVAALAIAGGYALYSWTSVSAQSREDGPGPNLVIEVAGAEANGRVVIDLDPAIAPNHVRQITTLAQQGAYDNVVFHRVLDGFMAQTGDVEFGKLGGDLTNAGMGKSTLPNIVAEFSDVPFLRGTVGMARGGDPDSANSQFFIMFAPGEFLNGDYTVVGHVIEGMDVVDRIKRGDPDMNGKVETPDRMVTVTIQ